MLKVPYLAEFLLQILMRVEHVTCEHLAYYGKGQQFSYTHYHFNIPIEKPIA